LSRIHEPTTPDRSYAGTAISARVAHRAGASVLLSALFGILSLGAPSHASAQSLYIDPQFGFVVTSAVVYASKPAGSPPVAIDLHLDLYEPTGAGVPSDRPAVLAIHAGGFTAGTRLNPVVVGICEGMAQRGYTCVSIDYRLAGDLPVVGPAFQPLETALAAAGSPNATPIAAGTEDTVTALQWLVDNAASLDIDPLRIGLAGYSSGGVLTEIVSYWINGSGSVSVPLPVQPRATFNLSGAIAAPVTVVEAGEPGAIIIHGDADATVDPAGAVWLDAQLQAVGSPSELLLMPGVGHTGFDIFTDEVAPGETYFDRVVDFFEAHVATATQAPVPGAGILGLSALVVALGLGGVRRISQRR